MPTINQLPTASSLSSSDQIPVYSSSNGDARKASLTTLRTWFEDNFASPEFETVLEAPTGSGFNIQLSASTENIWLIANPTGAFAAGTVTLPPVADCFDGQQIIVTCSEAVTALTVAGNGATIVGAPTALGTGGFFSLRFRESQDTWYCTSQSLGATDSFAGNVSIDGNLTVGGDVDVAGDSIVGGNVVLTGAVKSADGETMLAFAQEGVGTAVNYPTFAYSTTGNEVALAALGSDTNIGVSILPKGAGTLVLGGAGDVTIDANTTGANISITAADGNVTLTSTGGTVFIPSPLSLTDSVTFPVSTIANLPASPVQGMRAIVTNANATTFHSVVAAGGANVVPVFYDGTNWRIG